MVSSTLGSPTKTCWKRRSSAGSFSIRSRYSSSVVAPIMCSSPRASIGLSMLPASIAESPPAPAPTTVCSSSMKVMTCPPASLISSRTALSRSSNSPRYFAPATIAARSRLSTRRPLRQSGTSPSTTRWARPSTTAVLPTPGLADEHRVVLGTPAEDLDHPADLGVAPDDRVEAPVLGRLGEVDGVLLERLVRRLGLRAGDAAVAADGGEALAQPGLGEAGVGEQLPGASDSTVAVRDEQVLGGDVVVLHAGGEVERAGQHPGERGARGGLLDGRAAGARQRLHRLLGPRGEGSGVDAGLARRGCGRCRPPGAAGRRAGGWARSGCCPPVVADSCAASMTSRLRVVNFSAPNGRPRRRRPCRRGCGRCRPPGAAGRPAGGWARSACCPPWWRRAAQPR